MIMERTFTNENPTPRVIDSPRATRTPRWEHFAHQTNIGVRGYGNSPDAAFAQLALATMAAITDLRYIEAHSVVTLECRAPDLELLLFDWVNTLLFEMDARHQLFCAFDVHIHGQHLEATIWGEPHVASRHHPLIKLEGATFTALHVAALASDTWMAQCVVTRDQHHRSAQLPDGPIRTNSA